MRIRRTVRVILSLLASASCMPLHAQAAARLAQQAPAARPIADAARLVGTETPVTIAGRAVVSSGKLQARVFDVAVEDASGGMRVFSRSQLADVLEGDSVVASGIVKYYRGDTELAATSIRVVPGPRRVITAHELALGSERISGFQGRLVRVHGRVAQAGHSEGGQWVKLRGQHGGSDINVWVPANHGAPIPLDHVALEDSLTVTGIVTAYQDNAEDPVVWQLIPRDAADVTVGSTTRRLVPWLLWAVLGIVVLTGLAALGGRVIARRQLGALRETEARYRQLLALSPDAVIVHGNDGRILFSNPAASQLLGVASEEKLVGRLMSDFIAPGSRAALGAAMSAGPEEEAPTPPRVRAQLVTADGGPVDVEITASGCVYHDAPAVMLLARDITAQLRYERDLHALALVDELTGLQNRRGFSLFAEQELARARRQGRVPMLVFADLDGLKQINDTHGHAAGDGALRLMARALRSILRETDIVARWSGDEFVALMGEGGDAAAESIGARLDAALAELAPRDQPFVVTASIGGVALDAALPLRDALERADAELYHQKNRAGRSLRLTPTHTGVVK